jgi:hypothetical protein
VLFCDLVGSIAIAAQLDPEEWRETVAGHQRAAAQAITRFGGHLAKYLGDGVMAFFGYPQAHDNDAERAARAGLAILDALGKMNDQLAEAVGEGSASISLGSTAIASMPPKSWFTCRICSRCCQLGRSLLVNFDSQRTAIEIPRSAPHPGCN